MFAHIFNPENWFFRITGRFVDIVLLSVLWAICCVPLFTIGPATAGLYYAVVKIVRNGESGYGLGFFFHSFKLNFKVGALTSLAALAAGFGLLCLGRLLFRVALAGSAGVVLYVAFCVLLLLPVGVLAYLFPVLSRFTFGVRGLISTCCRLAMAHLPSTVALALMLYACAVLCLNFWWPVLFLPALAAVAASSLLERIFKPYLAAQTPPEG